MKAFNEDSRGPPFNPSSDSIDQARAFLGRARTLHLGSGKRFIGSTRLPLNQYIAIEKAADSNNLVMAIKNRTGIGDGIYNLFERFEEMCRRQHIAVSDELRPAIVQLLAMELFSNSRALNLDTKDLVSFTLYQGARGRDIAENPEFFELSNTPHLFKRAALGHPASPDRFLRTLSEGKKAAPHP